MENNTKRLLQLIASYSQVSDAEGQETWIMQVPLQVLIFEGIQSKIFDWDYSPMSIPVEDGRVILNISQESKEAIYKLLKENYIQTLKLTTNEHLNITCYQVNVKGRELLSQIDIEDRSLVTNLVQCSQCQSQLSVKRKDREYIVFCPGDSCFYEKKSTVTEAEDVSYFCMPYFPKKLTHFDYEHPEKNIKRLEAYLKKNPQGNIKDNLEKLSYFSEVRVLIGEWLPLNYNQLAALNSKLSHEDSFKHSKFTQKVDFFPDEIMVKVPKALTSVSLRDYHLTSYLDFEAASYLPEAPSIVQVEEFAVHVNYTGQARYGLELLAANQIHDKKIPLDFLPRILLDIQESSIKIMDTLLTNYQNQLMDVVYNNNAHCRNNYFFVIADGIKFIDKKKNLSLDTHKLTFQEVEDQNDKERHKMLEKILESSSLQNEVKQITKTIDKTYIFQDGSALIIGSAGSILLTQFLEKYEIFVTDFLFIMGTELFLDNLFTRLFLANDDLHRIQELIKECEVNPGKIGDLQKEISSVSNDCILLKEVRDYLEGSLQTFCRNITNRDQSTKNNYEKFELNKRIKILSLRIKELENTIKGTQEHLRGIAEITKVLNEKQFRRMQESLSRNTKSLEEVTKTSERSNMSLFILEIIMAGSLAFSIMNQLTGEWSISEELEFKNSLQKVFDTPGAWLGVSLLMWLFVAFLLLLLLHWIKKINSQVLTIKFVFYRPCNIEKLESYLAQKTKVSFECEKFSDCSQIVAFWQEKKVAHWHGCSPKIEISYDKTNSLLLSAGVEIGRPSVGLNEKEMEDIFLKDFQKHGII